MGRSMPFKGEEYYRERTRIASMQSKVDAYEYVQHVTELLDELGRVKEREAETYRRLTEEQERVIILKKQARGEKEDPKPPPDDPMDFIRGLS
jgi:hypothetical protein